jgi:type I restriction enzyme, S subunit
MWPEVPLDQLGYVSRGKSRHRPRNDPSLYGGGYPFIQTAEVKSAKLHICNHTQTYSQKGFEQSRLWPENTLCITIAANIADTAILGYPACFPDSIIGFIANEDICDVRFVKYYFDIVQERMKMVSQGATQDNLSQDKLLRFGIPCPPIAVQRAIGTTLSSYDSLIETNQRRVALLEEFARLLYREWFVSFRYPGHAVEMSSELPQGWLTRPLSEMAEVNRASLGAKDKPEEIQYIDIASVETGVVLGATKMPYGDAPGRARRLVKHGDVIWSCVRPNRCSYALMWEPDEDVVVSTGFAVLTASSVPFSYLYFATTSDEFVAYLTNRATGAAYPAVSGKDFEEAPLLYPSSEVLQSFDEKCLPILELRSKLILQNAHLTEARNALLPKIMSGELAI